MALTILGSLFTIVCSYYLIRGYFLLREMDAWRKELQTLGKNDLEQTNFEEKILKALKAAGLAPENLDKLDLTHALRSAQSEALKKPGTPFKIKGTNTAVIANPQHKDSES